MPPIAVRLKPQFRELTTMQQLESIVEREIREL